jgi:hypothetical protein
MIERLDELKRNGVLKIHWKPPIDRSTAVSQKAG